MPLKMAVQKQSVAIDEQTVQDLVAKFNIAYTIAKNEEPFTKYEPWLKTHAKNGVKLSPKYATQVYCAKMVACIAEKNGR